MTAASPCPITIQSSSPSKAGGYEVITNSGYRVTTGRDSNETAAQNQYWRGHASAVASYRPSYRRGCCRSVLSLRRLDIHVKATARSRSGAGRDDQG